MTVSPVDSGSAAAQPSSGTESHSGAGVATHPGDGVRAGLGIIWAAARGGAIGRAGEIPWHLPEDLAHFKQTTLGAPVIMGRRTWQSLPERFRPLPGRENIVVTRNVAFQADGASVVTSFDAALAAVGVHRGEVSEVSGAAAPSAWVIGGGQLYRAAMPYATELVITRIDIEVSDADTFAPEIGPQWQLKRSTPQLASRTGIYYRIERWM